MGVLDNLHTCTKLCELFTVLYIYVRWLENVQVGKGFEKKELSFELF